MLLWHFALCGFCKLHDKSTIVKEYKEKVETLKKEKDATSKKLGEVIVFQTLLRDFALLLKVCYLG